MIKASKIISSLKWSSASQIGRQLIQYFTTLILIRYLIPSEFGMMAMIMVVIMFLNMFKDLGTGSAIIHKSEISSEFIKSIFWLNFVFGLFSSLSLFLASDLIAAFYSNENLAPLLKVVSITFLVSSFSIVNNSVLEKELEFNKLANIEVLSALLGSGIAIYLAVNGYGVWSLVWQYVIIAILTTIFLWKIKHIPITLYFKISEIKKISFYSSNLMGFNIINYFIRNLDYFLIAKFLGDHLLGHYYLAYRIVLYPMQNITVVVGRVMFPVYSNIKLDNERIRQLFLKVSKSIAFISFPIMFGLASISSNLVVVVFGDQWNHDLIVTLLYVLAPVGLLQSISASVGAVYQSKGRTDLMLKWGILNGVIVIISFIIGINWGVIGVAVSYLVANIILLYPMFVIPFSLIDLKFLIFIKSLSKIFFISLLMSAISFLIVPLIGNNLSQLYVLILQVVVISLIYLFINFKFNRTEFDNLIQTLKKV